ncbi:MAG: M23 family metallopeptidase [Eubacterium sp.]|nr:M23 family metallopeptidase [Eubacterium sp.]
MQGIFSDAVYFPVPQAADEKVTVTYENSWQSQRTYGGVRGHEGCDLMASVQQRGYYPVVSVSDGVVEKIGWLPQGGYRIGIRSSHQVYYYYAHLAEYEDGIEEGTEITAGQLIGYMGDTGYSEVEGTTGNFPVHLHFGIYLDLEGLGEVSFNPYYVLRLLEAHKLNYVYRK